MAKISALLIPEAAHAMRGLVDVYRHRYYGWIARAWPHPHRPCETPAWKATAERMRETWRRIHAMSASQVAAWKRATPPSAKAWTDLVRQAGLTASQYGHPLLGAWNATLYAPSWGGLYLEITGVGIPELAQNYDQPIADAALWIPWRENYPAPLPGPYPPCPKSVRRPPRRCLPTTADRLVPLWHAAPRENLHGTTDPISTFQDLGIQLFLRNPPCPPLPMTGIRRLRFGENNYD